MLKEIPKYPRFEILNDKINGRIPVSKIWSWKEILSKDIFTFKNQFIFRGQQKSEWELTPSLGRYNKLGHVTKEIAEIQLHNFKQATRGRIEDYSLTEDRYEDELWAVGQHLGLHTPLLDWTYSPFVALFFAFLKKDDNSDYRAIYALNKDYVLSINDDRIRLLEPQRDSYGRLVNQAGLFTICDYNTTIENALFDTMSETLSEEDVDFDNPQNMSEYIFKLYIKNIGRKECLDCLRTMNIHHGSLFPDMYGASEYCNLILSDELKR